MVSDLFERSPRRIIDYTPAVICLAKIFEREINLSVVHWLRESFGIELPEYFNRYRPNLPKKDTTFDDVNFNMGRDVGWYPPETGKSLRTLQVFAENPDGYPQLNNAWIDILKNEVLFTNWGVIKEERNTAAHNRIVNENSASTVQCALNKLSANCIFETLHQMKTQYRGN